MKEGRAMRGRERRLQPIPIARARELLEYDGMSGELRWKADRRGRARAGSLAGACDAYGYRVLKIDARNYKAHRVAWALWHGKQPPTQLDHVNGCRHDNRIENLRPATHAENMRNRGVQVNSRTGVPGVTWHKHTQKYRAHISVKGKKVHLGYYWTVEEAGKAVREAKEKYFGEFAPEGPRRGARGVRI